MPGRSLQPQTRPYEVAIVGNDMLLAVLPGRAVQLAHAALAAGFDLVVPVSWGEELLAHRTLRALEKDGPRPLVFCACQLVRRRLLASGHELVPHLLSFVSPPVATARYLRALQPDVPVRITYLGACEEACDPSIDHRMPPTEFLDHLERSRISILDQPEVFESTIPPDRRRYWSQPGGVPTAEALAAGARPHALRVLETRELVTEIADHLLTAERALIDAGPSLGCVCAGAVAGKSAADARASLVALEPPRSQFPVVDVDVPVDLEEPLPPRREDQAAHPAVVTQDEARRPDSWPRPRQVPLAPPPERRRFAVTPARVGEVRGPVTAQPAPPGRSVTRASPVATVPAREASGAHLEHRPQAPAPTPAVAATPADFRGTPVAPPAGTPIEAAPPPVAPQPESRPPAAARHTTQRRTPTHEMRRVAAQARKHSNERPTPPRGYAAFRRHRVRSEPPPAEVTPSIPDDQPVLQGPTPVARASDAPAATRTASVEAATVNRDPSPPPAAFHRNRQRVVRFRAQEEPVPRVERPRRLWVLLFSVVLIAAIGVLLFVMLGG